jgi:hypothetical protein
MTTGVNLLSSGLGVVSCKVKEARETAQRVAASRIELDLGTENFIIRLKTVRSILW